MLSVTNATVHQTMCSTTPKPNSSPARLGRSERLWGIHNPFAKNIYRRNTTKNDSPIYITTESTHNDSPITLNNVSVNVVAAPRSRTPEKEFAPITFTVKENIRATNKDDESTVVANGITENEELWICDENDSTLTNAVTPPQPHPPSVNDDNTSDEVENCLVKETISVERKRKRGVQGRMENAVKYLKTSDNISVASLPQPNPDDSIGDVSNNDAISNDTLLPIQNEDVNTWNTKDGGDENWEEVWQTDNNIYSDMPYYMTGFPNPPGENLCWLNATLQALFILPLIDYLDRVDMNECSRLTKTFVAIQHYWKKGVDERETTYQIVKKFKEELSIIDETYPSQKQQDVSEFLMIFLNYIKTECEQLAVANKSMKCPSDETENLPENGQDIVNNISRVQTTPKKRVPLAAISPLKQTNNINEMMESVDVNSLKNLDVEPIKTLLTSNPIDDFFLLHMLEHYICKGCSEHRRRNIENLMLYVDIPDKDTEIINLTDAIAKSMEPEERSLTCAKCKYTKHNVSTTFRRSPGVLIVQINRYGMTNEGIVEKINTAVNIPDELTLERTDDDEIDRFKPVSIIAHVGSAMDCGHYTSYAIHGDQWIHYNDMDVVPMSNNEALTAAQTTAYLVFFVNVKLHSKNSDVFDRMENPLR